MAAAAAKKGRVFIASFNMRGRRLTPLVVGAWAERPVDTRVLNVTSVQAKGKLCQS